MIEQKAAKPFIKWAGGKRQIISELKSHIPCNYGDYFELFLGGGALFFDLYNENKMHYLNDINSTLIKAYKSFKTKAKFQRLIKELETFEIKNSKENYYQTRNNFNNGKRNPSEFIYLNRTCFNGLYRENSLGQFNVPFGGNDSHKLFNYSNLNLVEKVISQKNVKIYNFDYSKFLNIMKEGDFVYLDPPYDSNDLPPSFTKYNSSDFGRNDQIKLRDFCLELNNRKIKFMISNHSTDFIKSLYSSKGFKITEILARRNINSNGNKRTSVSEVLIKNYE